MPKPSQQAQRVKRKYLRAEQLYSHLSSLKLSVTNLTYTYKMTECCLGRGQTLDYLRQAASF